MNNGFSTGALQVRLKNCIQTILELEPEIGRGQDSRLFSREFHTLRSFLDRVDAMVLVEDDVVRLESATADFLAVLRLEGGSHSGRLVQ